MSIRNEMYKTWCGMFCTISASIKEYKPFLQNWSTGISFENIIWSKKINCKKMHITSCHQQRIINPYCKLTLHLTDTVALIYKHEWEGQEPQWINLALNLQIWRKGTEYKGSFKLVMICFLQQRFIMLFSMLVFIFETIVIIHEDTIKLILKVHNWAPTSMNYWTQMLWEP